MAIEAIIFDKDGVLTESEHLQFEKWRHAVLEYSRSIKKMWVLSAKDYIIASQEYPAEGLLVGAFNPPIPEEHHAAINEAAEEYYQEVLVQHIMPVEYNRADGSNGVTKLLDRLKGYRLALATGAPEATIKSDLKSAGLDLSRFQVRLSGEQFENNKPAPDVYLAVAEKLQLPPEKCLVIEDSLIGVKAAKAAGMSCIARINPFFARHLQGSDIDYRKSLKDFGAKEVVRYYKAITPELINR